MPTTTADRSTDDQATKGHECTGGWTYVSHKWAEQEALVELPDGTKVVDEERLASLLNTVYPCRVCNPAQFYRWAGGHMDPAHDRLNCAECREGGTARHARALGRGRARAEEPPPTEPPVEQPELPAPPPRRDID